MSALTASFDNAPHTYKYYDDHKEFSKSFFGTLATLEGPEYLNEEDLTKILAEGNNMKALIAELYSAAIGKLKTHKYSDKITLVYGDVINVLTAQSPQSQLLSQTTTKLTIQEFCKMMFGLFGIDFNKENSDAKKAYDHLLKIFNNIVVFHAIINNSLIIKGVLKLLLTDINLLIFKSKHCNKEKLTYLGDEFATFWHSQFELTLVNAQLYHMVYKITTIPINAPPTYVITNLLKLFNNKLSGLTETKNAELMGREQKEYINYNSKKEQQSQQLDVIDPKRLSDNGQALDIEPGQDGRRDEGQPQQGATSQKYLKYKTKYLRLKNSGF